VLEELRITGLGVIDSATLELGPGLTVITGETGAGKTMVVTALGLLLGGRADSGAVRVGSRSARVEGTLRVSELPEVAEAVDAAGGEIEDDHVLLARNVSAEGRSRAYVGGASVPVSRLADVAEPLVAVHGQSDQHRLLLPRAQREALDAFGGADVETLLRAYRELYTELRATEDELADVVDSARERAREADLLRFGLQEIEAVSPRAGEDEALAEEEQRLGHADALRTAAGSAREALSSDEGDPDALAAVSAARTLLEGVRDHDPAAGELADRIAEITYLLSDVAADVASYADGLEADPARLATVSERRAALIALTRKYGDSAAEVLAWAEASAARLAEIDDTDDRITRLGERRDDLRARLGPAAAALSAARRRAASRLSEQLTGELDSLAMPHAVLEVVVSGSQTDDGLEIDGRRWRFGSSGVDEVAFLLSANTGSEPRPLAKGVSGGELSRVMLALEVALAGTSPVPTFVFDEVDSGVGGKAAVEVGRRLAALARSAQVLVVTHLPQVAAYADRHVVVEKASDGSVTTSDLTVLDPAGRERELSRMFAGMDESETALAHARELLESAGHASS
jgi:DNA repair protein RecN (Recombination protein N)